MNEQVKTSLIMLAFMVVGFLLGFFTNSKYVEFTSIKPPDLEEFRRHIDSLKHVNDVLMKRITEDYSAVADSLLEDRLSHIDSLTNDQIKHYENLDTSERIRILLDWLESDSTATRLDTTGKD